MVTISSLMDVLQSKDTVLGLDAYGVIYNDDGVFNDVLNVFDYCSQHGIDLFLMTNNVVQTMVEISNKLHGFGLSISPDRIISSGCGCYLLPKVKQLLHGQRVFVYGYPSSEYYVKKAGGNVVSSPKNADVIVFAASLGNENHRMYKQVFDVLLDQPDMPVICANTDFYIMNLNGLKPVMGLYAHQMAHQLKRDDWVWIGKPYPLFSNVVDHVLKSQGIDSSSLVFCDDNPHNVLQLSSDLNCQGVVISETGIARQFDLNLSFDHLLMLSRCRI